MVSDNETEQPATLTERTETKVRGPRLQRLKLKTEELKM